MSEFNEYQNRDEISIGGCVADVDGRVAPIKLN